MPISLYARNKMMDGILAVSFVSLHSKSPKGSGENELVGETYKRLSLSEAMAPSSDGEKTSVSEVSFKNLPESLVTHVGIWDAEAGGNLLWSAELDEKQQMHRGNTLTLPVGCITLGVS
jgi:hypothetical protein